MTKTQTLINEMHEGNVQTILDNISSKTPILVLNAIVAGTRQGITQESFIAGVEVAAENHVKLLGIPLSKFAKASLHLLGKRNYEGSDPVVISMIDTNLQM